ncbi:MAG: hypothetical protein ABSF64_31920 [Bryobacteraceae bacterium]|jgi:hypothetical protein
MSEVEISRLDHCTGRQLKELLALASTDERTARDWLLEIGDREQMEYLLTEMCAAIGQSGGELLRAVCSPDTPVEVLVSIKSAAKRLAAAADAPAQNAAATLLYHLSIASALGYHVQNISSKDVAGRLALYRDLAAELSDDEFAAIFEKAIAGAPSVKP